MDLTDCPDQTKLERFVIGDLTGSELARLSSHIEQCDACEHALATLDGVSDSLLYGLRRLGTGIEGSLEPVPEGLLAKVRSQRSLAGSASWLSNGVPGQSLGRFELLEQVGVGSFGYVFRARDTELGRLVAIKIPRAGHLASMEDAARFLREARSAAQLKHPGIVTIHETGQAEDGTFYLVEEFVQGTTLSARLKQGPVPFRDAAELIAAVCDALECAHSHGVIHRDIKPANILLDADGRPHLMDFGLAKREAEETVMTQDGQVLGTPAYMSPEQARGESHRVDVRTDIYSAGVVLYELLTG
jgi:serine/threonine protein kinase